MKEQKTMNEEFVEFLERIGVVMDIPSIVCALDVYDPINFKNTNNDRFISFDLGTTHIFDINNLTYNPFSDKFNIISDDELDEITFDIKDTDKFVYYNDNIDEDGDYQESFLEIYDTLGRLKLAIYYDPEDNMWEDEEN